jgi:hypothetical protein
LTENQKSSKDVFIRSIDILFTRANTTQELHGKIHSQRQAQQVPQAADKTESHGFSTGFLADDLFVHITAESIQRFPIPET